jgi:hypothetical protein
MTNTFESLAETYGETAWQVETAADRITRILTVEYGERTRGTGDVWP